MENLSYLIIKVSKHLKNSLDNKLKEYDVTASQFAVLNKIQDKDEAITSAEVADKLSSDRPTISGIVNRLEKKGLLEKIPNPKDKRSSYLKLSKEGSQLVDKLRDVSDGLNYEIFSDFTDRELKYIKEYLLRIVERVEEL